MSKYTKDVTIKVIDWESVPDGTEVKLKLSSISLKGIIIHNDDNIVICHNNSHFAALSYHESPIAKALGKMYAVNIKCTDNTSDLLAKRFRDSECTVSFGSKVKVPKMVILPPIEDYEVVAVKGKVYVGCHPISNDKVLEIFTNLIE